MLSDVNTLVKTLDQEKTKYYDEREKEISTFEKTNKLQIQAFTKFMKEYSGTSSRLDRLTRALEISPDLETNIKNEILNIRSNLQKTLLTLAYITNTILKLDTSSHDVQDMIAGWLQDGIFARVLCKQSDFQKDYERDRLDTHLIEKFKAAWAHVN